MRGELDEKRESEDGNESGREDGDGHEGAHGDEAEEEPRCIVYAPPVNDTLVFDDRFHLFSSHVSSFVFVCLFLLFSFFSHLPHPLCLYC